MKKTIAFLALVGLSGCAYSARTVGMQDPSVEIVRTLAAAQAQSIKSLTDALVRAQATSCVVPEIR